jgi:hypothetical protein|mmetsp:Transcript_25301/g.27630  ORF Transcript_25301/g.27630 Transcript_25301/m.27630 type:complete len:344 (-) Transcript_25301:650-1681(-)
MEQEESTSTLRSELYNLKKKIGHQDGKLFLLSAQIEKYRGLNEGGLEELNHIKNLLDEKKEENGKLQKSLCSQKSLLQVANGKIHLLQYQLTKMKDNTVLSRSEPDRFMLHSFLLHHSKYQNVLNSLVQEYEIKRRNQITRNPSPQRDFAIPGNFVRKLLDPQDQKAILKPELATTTPDRPSMSFATNDSFGYSRLLKNQSLYSDIHSQNEISSYSLNTTIEPRYLLADQSILKTPSLHKNSVVEVTPPRERRRNFEKTSRKAIDSFDEVVLDGDCQKNINELKKNINKEGFSIFSSPVSFRENISKIRVENEKLRHDIYRFRGKLEVSYLTNITVFLSLNVL